MTWWEAIVLGLVQALTEFLPISSSAHVRIVGSLLLDGADVGAMFTAVIQIGTELAVLVYFRHDIARIIAAWWRSLRALRRPDGGWRNPFSLPDPDARMGWLIILGSVPIVLLGVLFTEAIEGALRDLRWTAATLVIFAVLLGLADRYGRKERELDRLTARHGVAFGLAQAMALIPGVSRSGGTITAGLAMGYTREAAARYSFLLAIPAVLGSGVYEAVRAAAGHEQGGVAVGVGSIVLATAVAFVVGFAVIVWFLRYVTTRGYGVFVVYRFALAALVLVLLATGVLEPIS
ncbi:undecaprenol kinase [Beutenbergia cavernae DSM 12333]|uniref:Undecaprenyl-diphosphatase n=1 Tax=Beutenbergia cavernae (strain ATCC BAA-8 / DSM 12333 / CCUG 43141 / JCM 11478 / NBRC 16432 / NCIMB 13614 / HKI 0122) TaxID=471853 RepID=C5BVB3_BEUC1|nr:undecaprenyl-diphosphate phosphatase [Beutenbergia cavernae]ACQ80500.1 undecaprenol kinase [Beutenbergia cavernae DSM 12333]